MRLLSCIITGLMLSVALSAQAEFLVEMKGKQEVSVASLEVRIGDIAKITPKVDGEDLAVKLASVPVISMQKDMRETTISGNDVVSALSRAGISTSSIGYSLPTQIKITRAMRELRTEDISQLLTAFFEYNKKDSVVQDIKFTSMRSIPQISDELKLTKIGEGKGNWYPIEVTAFTDKKPEATITGTAKIEEFALAAVAARPIERGATVSEQDVMLARMSKEAIKNGVQSEVVVGALATRPIGEGEAFLAKNTKIQPTIPAGSSVTMRYSIGALEATATGVAVDSGFAGEEIRVRNEQSKKLVRGKIIESGLVQVER